MIKRQCLITSITFIFLSSIFFLSTHQSTPSLILSSLFRTISIMSSRNHFTIVHSKSQLCQIHFLQATQSPLLFRSLSFPIPSPSTSTQSTSLHLREAHDATTLPIRGVRCHHTPLSSASHSLLNFSVCFPLHLLLFFLFISVASLHTLLGRETVKKNKIRMVRIFKRSCRRFHPPYWRSRSLSSERFGQDQILAQNLPLKML